MCVTCEASGQGRGRFGTSHLLLPVNVCCANIAFFGDYFMFREGAASGRSTWACSEPKDAEGSANDDEVILLYIEMFLIM